MQTKTFEAPALYGDHHVMEVRRILLGLQGVVDVYASSAFQTIQVTFDPEKIQEGTIEARLRETGYLDELPIPAEPGGAVRKAEDKDAFRHTAVYETVKNTVAFAQRVPYRGRPLWYCPGMGAVKAEEN
ncbi:MAG: hypothetical protein OHK0041_24820 [Anaerolineales bacterium]